MKYMSYMDHRRGMWIVRLELNGRRCEIPVRLIDGCVLDHELAEATEECARLLEIDYRERHGK